MALRDYLTGEVAQDHADGLLSRREALRRLGLMGLSTAGAAALLGSCHRTPPSGEGPGPAPPGTGVPGAESAVPGQPVRFPGFSGELMGTWAEPRGQARGA